MPGFEPGLYHFPEVWCCPSWLAITRACLANVISSASVRQRGQLEHCGWSTTLDPQEPSGLRGCEQM